MKRGETTENKQPDDEILSPDNSPLDRNCSAEDEAAENPPHSPLLMMPMLAILAQLS